MRFLATYIPSPGRANVPPTKQHMDDMDAFVAQSMKAGVLVATGGLLPVSSGGARVRRSDGKVSVIDGPFTEAKELVAGFAVLEATSRDHALEMTRQFLHVAGDGECELRQIMDGPHTK